MHYENSVSERKSKNESRKVKHLSLFGFLLEVDVLSLT